MMVGIKMAIGEKGQVVIPKPLREEFNLMPNDKVEFDVQDRVIVLKKVSSSNALEAFSKAKSLATKKFTEGDYKKINWDELYEEQFKERGSTK